ncbi:MAG: fibronectin type III domain-containing protein, partial [Ekhidna sp.]|nr:fibronectin type III domain-containing protein [Ekhidna sp.]
TANDTISINQALTTDTLSFGFHILGIRARAQGGAWSTTETRLVFVDQTQGVANVDQIEYFFDSDPGVGNATIIDSFTANDTISIDESLNTTSLPFGFHVLGMRAKAQGGAWSTTESRLIFVDQSQNVSEVEKLEYFFDQDPGVGNGIAISSFSPETSISITESIDASDLSVGFHILGIRGKDAGDSWGFSEIRLVYVDQTSIIGEVTEMEYFISADPGVRNGQPISISTPSDSVTEEIAIHTDTLSIGRYEIYVRAKDPIKGWGIYESRSFEMVDMAPPTISSPDAPFTNQDTVRIDFTFQEPVDSFDETDLILMGDAFVISESFTALNDSTFSINLGFNSEGLLTIDIPDSAAFAQDDATASPPAIPFEITYDNSAPTVTVDSLFTLEVSPELNGSVDDDSVFISILLNGNSYPAVVVSSGRWQIGAGVISPLQNGVYDILVSATDLAGNIGNDTTTNELIMDRLEVTVDTLSTTQTSPELTGTVTDATAVVDVTVAGSTYTATVNPNETWMLPADVISPALTEGVYEVVATADRGIEGPITDLTANELTIIIPTVLVSINPISTNNRSPELTGTISNPSATIEVLIDGSTYLANNNGDSSWVLTEGSITPELGDGIYDVAILADVNGTLGADSTVNEVRIDGTAPQISVDFLATSISSPELTGIVDDPSATVRVEVDGNTYEANNNGDNTWSLTASTISPGLGDNTYSVQAQATDSLGNLGFDETENELIITSTLLAVSPTDITAQSFTARWSQGQDVLNYQLDVSTTSDFQEFLTGYESFETTATSVAIEGLDFGTNYYYRVRLVNTASEVSANSNTERAKTVIDLETIADSLAVLQIFESLAGNSWDPAVNWENDRMRNWDGISLNEEKQRIAAIDIGNRGALGEMPPAFEINPEVALSQVRSIDLSNNQISGLLAVASLNVQTLNVASNSLDFADLELMQHVPSLTYSPQEDLNFLEVTGGEPLKIPHLSDQKLTASAGGSSTSYQFFRNNSNIGDGSAFSILDSALTINSINFESMGTFSGQANNTLLPDLTLNINPQIVLATADLSVRVVDEDSNPIEEMVSGYLMEAVRRRQGFDTVALAEDVGSTFDFSEV